MMKKFIFTKTKWSSILTLFIVSMAFCSFERGDVALKLDGILFSQIGYDQIGQKRVVLRDSLESALEGDSKFELYDLNGKRVGKYRIKYWGKKWRENWWIADFTDFTKEGEYMKCPRKVRQKLFGGIYV